jgi:Peptidase family C25
MQRIPSAVGITAMALTLALPLHGASTGTTQLHMPQGSGSGTAFGDYVSDANGLDTSYHYYVEVPSGLSRMVVDIFDADVGLGGTAEATAGRDRDRGTFNTSATYSVFNPNGAQRNTQFTTGDATGPVGSDNAWLTLFDTTGDTVRDNFTTAAYTNNDGLMSWSTNWIETNDDNNAGNGQIRITGGELRIGDNGGAVSTIEREANLSGFTTATFSFDFRTTGVDAGDQMRVEVSSNGGTSWTTLETFTGPFAASSRSYNITSSIATNTRIRFIEVTGYGTNDFFFVDNLQIKDSAIKAGHWEVRVDQSSAVTAGDSINAIGIRAHDGTSGAGGTELNVYAENQVQLGANPPASGTNSRTYTLYPWITSGCSASKNDFDYDSTSGNVGSMTYTSRTGAFAQSYASAALSGNNAWRSDSWSGWTSDQLAGDYGIWTAAATVTSYLVAGTPNGNYAQLYLGNYQAAANPPAANPVANSFRIYLPTDAGSAPSKPYVDQTLTFTGCGGLSGPNPPVVGQTSCYTVTVRVVNPAAQAITFSASNLVTANLPGSGAVYAGIAQVSQGTVTAQPAVGGTGNITWNPGTVAAGTTALLAYRVKVTPTTAGQRIPVTATPASGNGTRAQYVDETGNTTQARATYLFGPLCELATTVGVITEAVVSEVHAWRGDGGGVRVEWRTASETGTSGFYLHRWDKAARRWVRVNDSLLAALQSAPQGGIYRFLDEGASPFEPQVYLLEEVEAGGGRRTYGPYAVAVDWRRPEESERRDGGAAYERTAWATPGRGRGEASKAARAGAGSPAGEHLTIRENGLYYLRTADVATWLGMAQGATEKLIAKGGIDLSRGGQPVAWMPDLDRQSKRAQGLFFYGEALDSVYATGSVYHLQRASGGSGLLMQVQPAAAAAGTGDGAFPARVHFEQDAFAATILGLDPESDYWFWDFLQADDPTYGHRSFTADAPALAPGAASLTVNLQGATDSGVAGEHHVLVALNGTPLGETSWQGITAHSASFDVPPGVLLASGNQVQLTAQIGNGAPYSILYVDSFDLSYRRFLRAAGDALAFSAENAQGLAVTGFSAPAVRLLDVSDPLRPRWLDATAQADPAAPATYRLGFVPQTGARYLAAAPAAFKSPAALRPWSAPSLLSSGNRADYLVLAPAALLGAAERLAGLRQSRGLTPLVVSLDQVFDEFGAGVPNPHVLQAFLAYAWKHWSLPPRYVVLAGAGTLDYRNLMGYGDCLVPPLLVQSTGGLFPSDNGLADVDGDGVPEMAVGRIPVLDAAGLDAYTAKVAAAEAGGTPEWARNAIFLSDNDDGNTNFSADSDRVSSQVGAAYTAQPIALRSTPLAAARDQLLSGLGQGASLVNYMGHGGLDRLSAGGLLTTADAAGLKNFDRLPLVTAMTCTISRFTVPGIPSLGEVLVTNGAGGAAAVWAPSGLADNAASRLLAELFYQTSSDPGDPPLGDRILRAFGELHGLGGDGSLLHLYNLLGDPALRLRHAPAPPAGGGTSGE